ncbi:trk system potassium uptake protein TrkA [Keratinibaculum paraultunense]|uniref:Trk system potassium uptake protein TrkA n=1 Tax=Keratinibaculum paraultunense TaxID=1278232 RepID=A0A4R3L0E4_9FIRM|nr:TrkA family potassium uptake protein [Keratinibaculum paraultunense]QQY80372.1 TrkA family potassium uptake protein [Keratinibaculum paraultunense]TCS90899.1 trk system potassium uptake protein TrkA [Keratinibaculum paraultunense]
MKQFAVIGCGRFGSSVAETLYELGHEVLAIDINEERVQEISDRVTCAVQADVSDEKVLIELGIRNFDVVIISIGSNYQASIMATLIAKELGVKKVIAKANDELHGKVLSKIGADRIIFPERDMGIRVAHNLVSSNILDFIELSPDYGILEITALDEWANKTLKELKLPSRYGISVMAIKRDKNINISPYADDVILKGDILVVLGNTNDIESLEQSVGE